MAAEGGRVGGRFIQSHVDRFQDANKIAIHIAIPKAKYSKAGPFELLIAPSIPRGTGVQIMLAAVDLYDKTMFQTDKVYDVAFARRLPPEMKPALSP